MDEIRISVVMATYNGAQHLAAQVNSWLACLGPHDEIVISDDGSNDGTRDVVAAIGDRRLHMVPLGPRLGYQGNFQRAIAASRGRYIFFSDQDDICLSARVEQSLAALASAWCVCGDATLVDQHLNVIGDSFFVQRKARFDAFSLFLRPAVIGATMACQRDFVRASLPFPDNIPHDMWLSIRAARRGKLAVVRQPFILYRRHEAAVSATGTSRRRGLSTILRERASLAWSLLTR